MNYFRVLPPCLLLIVLSFVVLVDRVPETNAVYAYTLKGYVQDLRHNPRLLVGGWFLLKAIKLKKLKLLFKLKKKLKLKFLAKKILLKFKGRRKRSVDEFDLPEHILPEIQENEIMPYFSMASDFDTDGCLPKSICEAMARRNHTYQMNHFERMVAEDLAEGRPDDTSAPSFIYEYAAFFGRVNRDESACASLFSNCREKPQMLKKFMDETFVSDICEGPDQIISHSTNLYEDEGRSNFREKTTSGDFHFPLN